MRFAVLAMSFAAFALFAAPALLPAATVWSMPTDYPADSMPGQGLTTFAAAVARTTAGSLTIEPVFGGSPAIKAGEVTAAVGDGRLTAGDVFGGVAGETDPIFLLSSLPFLTGSFADAQRLYDAAKPAYAAAFERHGLKLLYVTPWPPSGIWAKKPIRTPDDLTGLSIRTYDVTSQAVMTSLGARAVSLSFSDAMPQIRDGSVVAVLSSGDGGAGRKLWDFLPSYTEIGYAVPLSFALVNKAAWDGLAPALRDAISRAAAETQTAQWNAVTTRIAQNAATMRSNGVTIVPDVSPELRKRLADAGDAAIRDWEQRTQPVGAGIITHYRQAGPRP
jgi:TRAP-type C4-dicarboxylate transport system substrate-binding protein